MMIHSHNISNLISTKSQTDNLELLAKGRATTLQIQLPSLGQLTLTLGLVFPIQSQAQMILLLQYFEPWISSKAELHCLSATKLNYF